MKKLLPLSLLLFSLNSFSQFQESTFKERVIDAFIPMISTLEIDGKVYEMKQDGEMVRQFEAGVAVKGYIKGSTEYDMTMQILPYEVRLTETGRVYIEVSPANIHIADSKDDFEFNFHILSIEYDKNYNYSGLKENAFHIINTNISAPVIGNNQSYLKANAQIKALGFNTVTGLTPTLNDGNSPTNKLHGFSNTFTYGLEYNQNFKNGTSMQVGINGKNKFAVSDHVNSQQELDEYQQQNDLFHDQWAAYHSAVNDWYAEKFQWEVENGFMQPTSNSHYISASGNQSPNSANYVSMARPEMPIHTLKRHQFSLQPKIGIQKDFDNQQGFIKGIGAEFNANIVIRDKINGTNETISPYDQNGQVNLERSNFTDNNRYNVKLILNF